MAIKNKDGSIYLIDKPNPIIIEQNIWQQEGILHNKFGKKIFYRNKIKAEDEPVVIKTTKTLPPSQKEDIIDIWCHPAYHEQKTDPLYGETHTIVKYREKFKFKGVLVESEDLLIRVACKEKIDEESILFPKNRDSRWWKVVEVTKNEDYLLTAIPSDIQPSFG